MRCRICRAETPDNSNYCINCGAKQNTKRKPKSRGNGQGSVYQLPNKSWAAVCTIGYTVGADMKLHRKTRSKQGFKTKREALEYLPRLKVAPPSERNATFSELYAKWAPTHNAGKSTMGCYSAALKYFEQIAPYNLRDITVDDLQECLDDCPKGKRTKENMRALCGLIYKYAIPRGYTANGLNMAEYLTIDAEAATARPGLPVEAVTAIENAVGTITGADYVLCQCYLGFRPSELLALDARYYNRKERAFVGGAKTDAGRDRVVTVSPKIQPIVDRLTENKISGPVFCAADGSALSLEAYRAMFYRVLDACGVDNPIEGEGDARRRRYTPHSCRHTFATLMKRVPGSDKDKLALMGHTSTEMLRHYQDVNYSDLRKITDAL